MVPIEIYHYHIPLPLAIHQCPHSTFTQGKDTPIILIALVEIVKEIQHHG